MAQREDFYLSAGQQRIAQLDAERSAAVADLQAFRASGDYSAASDAIQRIANLDSERSNLENLYQRYVQSQTPYQPPPMTDSELNALPPEKMNVDHVLHSINRTSKYATDLDTNNPYVRHGIALAAQRRQRGE
jgi:hypothetical protein